MNRCQCDVPVPFSNVLGASASMRDQSRCLKCGHPLPLVRGGQGRTPDDLRDGAGALVWALAAALVLAIALAIGGCL